MIEIALCLAIIGFALVAIIGVLPTGLNVQKENREETIINQEAVVLMDALRNGSRGYDDLTNYVLTISNVYRLYNANGVPLGPRHVAIYTPTTSTLDGSTMSPPLPLTSGARIIGLLSTPKYVPETGAPFQSNYVAGYFRAMSGSAVDKVPAGHLGEMNPIILADAFAYKVIAEIVPYVPYDTNAANTNLATPGTDDWTNRFNFSRVVANLQTNSHDLRLTFRWPILPTGDPGPGRQSFRVFNSGYLRQENDLGQTLYFFQPSTYIQTNMP